MVQWSVVSEGYRYVFMEHPGLWYNTTSSCIPVNCYGLVIINYYMTLM